MVGVTDRALPGRLDDDVKNFRVDMKLEVPLGCENLFDCTISRSAREFVTNDQYVKQLQRDYARRSKDGFYSDTATVYAHGFDSTAGGADLEALSLSVIAGAPVVIADWRSTPGIIDAFHVPQTIERYNTDVLGAQNKVVKFASALDQTIEILGAGRTNFLGFSRGTSFEARYMVNRADEHLQELRNVVLTHPDLERRFITANDTAPYDSASSSQTFSNKVFDSSACSMVLASDTDLPLISAPHLVPGARRDDERIGFYTEANKEAVLSAGGMYLKDEHNNSNGQHFINYRSISDILNEKPAMLLKGDQDYAPIAGDIG